MIKGWVCGVRLSRLKPDPISYCCVALGKLLNFFVPQSPNCKDKNI